MKCNIEGCGRPRIAKGFCAMHYYRFFKCHNEDKSPQPLHKIPDTASNHQCIFESCDKPQYAKGYCRKHHAMLLVKGEVKYEHIEKKCLVKLCNALTTSKNGYCKFHNTRLRFGIPLDLPRQVAGGGRGKRNANWKGGIAEYPNHSLMKRNRKEVLKEANYICQFCGGIANQIHHKDLSKDNHAKENLVACCHKCNHLPEHTKPSTSKYRRLYGLTTKELIKAGLYDEIREIHKKLENFKSATLQVTP